MNNRNIDQTPTVLSDQWRDLLTLSAERHHASVEKKREARGYLWLGAQAAVADWLKPESQRRDPIAEGLYRDMLEILGRNRRGTASKIATVARASATQRMDLRMFGSLNAAYDAAVRISLGENVDLPPVKCKCSCH